MNPGIAKIRQGPKIPHARTTLPADVVQAALDLRRLLLAPNKSCSYALAIDEARAVLDDALVGEGL